MHARDHVRRACEIVGGVNRLAALIGVTPPTVSQWRTGDRNVPIARCPAIERITGGAVTCEELRPDVDWAVLRGQIADPSPGPAAEDEGGGAPHAELAEEGI